MAKTYLKWTGDWWLYQQKGWIPFLLLTPEEPRTINRKIINSSNSGAKPSSGKRVVIIKFNTTIKTDNKIVLKCKFSVNACSLGIVVVVKRVDFEYFATSCIDTRWHSISFLVVCCKWNSDRVQRGIALHSMEKRTFMRVRNKIDRRN